MTENTFETLYTTSRRVACDGGEGALGHPRVWLELGDNLQVECPYCSRRYILKNDNAQSAPGDSHKNASSAISSDV